MKRRDVDNKIPMKLSEALSIVLIAIEQGKYDVAKDILLKDIMPTVKNEEEPGGRLA